MLKGHTTIKNRNFGANGQFNITVEAKEKVLMASKFLDYGKVYILTPKLWNVNYLHFQLFEYYLVNYIRQHFYPKGSIKQLEDEIEIFSSIKKPNSYPILNHQIAIRKKLIEIITMGKFNFTIVKNSDKLLEGYEFNLTNESLNDESIFNDSEGDSGFKESNKNTSDSKSEYTYFHSFKEETYTCNKEITTFSSHGKKTISSKEFRSAHYYETNISSQKRDNSNFNTYYVVQKEPMSIDESKEGKSEVLELKESKQKSSCFIKPFQFLEEKNIFFKILEDVISDKRINALTIHSSTSVLFLLIQFLKLNHDFKLNNKNLEWFEEFENLYGEYANSHETLKFTFDRTNIKDSLRKKTLPKYMEYVQQIYYKDQY